jgi:hypothetical protein
MENINTAPTLRVENKRDLKKGLKTNKYSTHLY